MHKIITVSDCLYHTHMYSSWNVITCVLRLLIALADFDCKSFFFSSRKDTRVNLVRAFTFIRTYGMYIDECTHQVHTYTVHIYMYMCTVYMTVFINLQKF